MIEVEWAKDGLELEAALAEVERLKTPKGEGEDVPTTPTTLTVKEGVDYVALMTPVRLWNAELKKLAPLTAGDVARLTAAVKKRAQRRARVQELRERGGYDRAA